MQLVEQCGSACAPSRSAAVAPSTRAQESHRAKKCPTHTLRVVIPSSSPAAPAHVAAVATTTTRTSEASSPIPTIEVVPPTPITPRSPIHPSYTKESKAAYTLTSYYELARRAPRTERVPHLPQFCPHSVRPFVPLHTSGCASCALQLFACDTWYSWSSASTGALRAPAVLPAKCTVETRSVYYALGIALGEIDRSCVDQYIVESIIIARRTAAVCRIAKKKSAARGPSRIHTLFRRARHVFSVPSHAPMMGTS